MKQEPLCVSNKFFVQILFDDGTYIDTIKTWSDILSFVDMKDCHNCEIKVFRSCGYGKIEELEVLGCWHDHDDPLKIRLVDKCGETICFGYGTDH